MAASPFGDGVAPGIVDLRRILTAQGGAVMPGDEALSTGEAGPIYTGFQDGRNRARSRTPPGTIAPLGYLTPQDAFGDVERGNPLPYTLPPEQRRAVGLERETWQLEVVTDPESNTKLERPLSRELGTALDFEGLVKLAEQHAGRYVKAITCNDIGEPL